MAVYAIDPLTDPRWLELLDKHTDASVFHTREWLEALKRTYGYEPVVYTTCAPDKPLANGIPFCLIDSWLTGRRLVSLPFSDHCQPLVTSHNDMAELLVALQDICLRDKLKYVEIRPLDDTVMCLVEHQFGTSEQYYMHRIDLRPDLDEIHGRFHKNAVRLAIRQAEREQLTYSDGVSHSDIDILHDLLMKMRRKHSLPPQPISWFRNVIDCLGDAAEVRIAKKDGNAIAAVIMLLYKGVCYYKYMGYVPRYAKLGGIPGLVWHTIEKDKNRSAQWLDYGRTDIDNETLAVYKDRWNGQRSMLSYYRYPVPVGVPKHGRSLYVAKAIFAHLPDAILKKIGDVLYKHIG